MPARRRDRWRLDGFALEIFTLVRKHATSEQWREWLRVPLEHAAANGNVDLFTRLMDAGADGSAGWRGCHGRTLLGAAAYGKSEEMVLRLIQQAGAEDDVNVKFGAKQGSALHVAAARGVEKICNALMLAGADPSTLDKDKQTPLHLAAQAGHGGVVDILLLKEGVDPNARRRLGSQTSLHLAAAGGHALCVSKLCVAGAAKDSRDLEGETPLHLAALNNRLRAVEELLAAGARLDIRAYYTSYSALDIAALWGNTDVVRALLLRHDSSVEACDDDGFTALHHAANNADWPDRDNGDVIRVLLEAGADIEAGTTGENACCSPLHLAVFGKLSGNVRALLEGGANANALRTTGGTPLHDACFQSCVDAVERLLSWGADEKLTDGNGETAEETLGRWGRHGRLNSYTGQRAAADERIRHMLARAPADRAWRRHGWLVLARSCPAKVQVAKEGNGGGGNGTGDNTRTDLERLVGTVVNLNVEGVFRLVVGFL